MNPNKSHCYLTCPMLCLLAASRPPAAGQCFTGQVPQGMAHSAPINTPVNTSWATLHVRTQLHQQQWQPCQRYCQVIRARLLKQHTCALHDSLA